MINGVGDTMIRYRVDDRVMQDLKNRSSLGLAFYMIVSFLVVTEEGYFQRNQLFSIVFLASLNGVCLIRILHLILYPKIAKIKESANVYIFMASVCLTALTWGLGFTYLLVQDGEFTGKVLMSVCTAGLAAGGVVAFIPERRLSIAFNLLMMSPSFLMLAIVGTSNHLALMIALYSVYLGMLTFRGSREYWDALENEYKLAQKSEELKLQSYTDALTGLNNRRFFNEIFDHEWKRASRNQTFVGIIMGDIDYFKRVNDTHGHGAGDEYLKEVSRILQATFKRTTDIVARYGGEEFIILLLDIPLAHMVDKAEEVRHLVEEMRVDYQGASIQSTMSFGCATCCPQAGDTPDSLINQADQVLYNAKRKGRNRVEAG